MTIIFGEKWDAPACEDAQVEQPPTHVLCLHCDESIGEQDQGFLQPFSGFCEPQYVVREQEGYALIAVHRECLMAETLGHIVGVCACTGWSTSSREAAREVQRRFLAGDLRLDQQP